MPLTPEQRAEINRQNARKSTGPKTEAGKLASRKNALKHGLRAEVVALPNEDPEAVQARADAWNDYYRPQSPAAQHLVNQCVNATLLADRVSAYHAAALSRQVRDAGPEYARARQAEVEALTAILEFHPDAAVRGLSRTAAGCRALIARWEALGRALEGGRTWGSDEADEAVTLQGARMSDSPLSPEAWQTFVHAQSAHARPSPALVAELFGPGRFPESLRGQYRPDALPSRESAGQTLRHLVLGKLTELRALEAEHRRDHEGPDAAEGPGRALVLADAPARLFLRYHAEARTSFHRAYSELVKTLARDAQAAEPEVPPNEAEAAPVVGSAPVQNAPDAASPERSRPDAPTPPPDLAPAGGPARGPAEPFPVGEGARTVPAARPATPPAAAPTPCPGPVSRQVNAA